MYPAIQHLHSYFAFIVLAGLLYSIIRTATLRNSKPYAVAGKKTALIGLISCHIQFLAGIILYLVSPLGSANLSAATMKDSTMRLLALEHPLTMLLAVVLVTIGYSKAKRASADSDSYKYILRFYGIGLVLILSRIPWKTWL